MRSRPDPESPADGPQPARPEDPSAGRSVVGFYATAGLSFGAVMLVFTAAGYWLDTRLGTLPVLTLLGALVGGAGGFFHLYRTLTGLRSGSDRRP
ncbi:MAG: AtpZ/AtpI family protein [Gemmatimonadota bacterium]